MGNTDSLKNPNGQATIKIKDAKNTLKATLKDFSFVKVKREKIISEIRNKKIKKNG